MLIFMLSAGCREDGGSDVSPQTDEASTGTRDTFGAGPVTLTTHVSSQDITTSDAVTWRLTVDVKNGFEADLPDILFPDDVPGAVLTHFDEDVKDTPTGRRIIRTYDIEPEFDGTITLPAVQVFAYETDAIQEELIESEPVDITVRETPIDADALELKPLRELVTVEEMERQHRPVWPWVLGSAVGIVLFVLLMTYWIRRPRREPSPPPAHEVAMDRLHQLVARKLVEAGHIEPFFVELTGIVRDYIEAAFHVRAPEQTTQEFLAQLRSSPAVAAHREQLEPFLTAADEVKFARATPEPAVIQRTFDTARDFILNTSKQPGVGA